MSSLRGGGFAVETRPFHPHLTLVRRRLRPLADAPTDPLAWQVERVSLVRSQRVEGSVCYREVDAIALVGANPPAGGPRR
jgi:2'-5' RNA ligase